MFKDDRAWGSWTLNAIFKRTQLVPLGLLPPLVLKQNLWIQGIAQQNKETRSNPEMVGNVVCDLEL